MPDLKVSSMIHRLKKRAARSGGRRQAAFTLIEGLVSVAITSIVVVGLMGGVMTALKSSALQRRSAISQVELRNLSEAFNDAPYVACAKASDYADAFKPITGFDIKVDAVTGWEDGSNPATFAAFASNCANARADTGLQRIEYSVSMDAGDGRLETRKHSMLKRYDGTLSELNQQVPAPGVRCNITADEDTFLDQAAPGANHGGAVSGRGR